MAISDLSGAFASVAQMDCSTLSIIVLRFTLDLETKKYHGCRFFGDGARSPAVKISRRIGSGTSCSENARMLLRFSMTPMEIASHYSQFCPNAVVQL